jgi:hypothetical protein
VLPPDINESKKGFVATDLAVRYGLDNVKGVGDATIDAITARPYQAGTTSRAKAKRRTWGSSRRSRSVPSTVGSPTGALEQRLLIQSGGDDLVVRTGTATFGPSGLPCTYDWNNEPVDSPARKAKKRKGRRRRVGVRAVSTCNAPTMK